MALAARLTWQAADPAALAASLVRRLGLRSVEDRDRTAIPLGSAVLEIVPWRAEQPADRPARGGRLVLEPAWEDADRTAVPAEAGDGLRLLGVAWCTVELDRAERELDMWLEAPGGSGAGGPAPADVPDAHLGAITRSRAAPHLPGGRLVLAEPTTEGRLAASLARDAEGPCGLYLGPAGGGADALAAWVAGARSRGVTLARREPGPFGPQVLVLGGVVAGPHVLVAEGPRADPSRRARRVPSRA